MDPTLGERFSSLRILSSEHEDVVYAAYDTYGKRHVSVRLVRKEAYLAQKLQIEREIANLWKLSMYQHPNIVHLREVLFAGEHLAIVMDVVRGGRTLGKSLEEVASGTSTPFSTKEARRIFQRLVLAVDFAHRLGIMHRDIRPDNILLSASFDTQEVSSGTTGELEYAMDDLGPGTLRLAGLGFSKSAVQGTPATRGGAVLYVAPELFTPMPSEGGVDEAAKYDGMAVDVWSCGVVLYETAYGGHPFIRAQDQVKDRRILLRQVLKNSVTGNIQFPDGATEDRDLVQLLQRMLDPNPQTRIRMPEVMQSQWFLAGMTEPCRSLNDRLLNLEQCLLQMNLDSSFKPELEQHCLQLDQKLHDFLQKNADFCGPEIIIMQPLSQVLYHLIQRQKQHHYHHHLQQQQQQQQQISVLLHAAPSSHHEAQLISSGGLPLLQDFPIDADPCGGMLRISDMQSDEYMMQDSAHMHCTNLDFPPIQGNKEDAMMSTGTPPPPLTPPLHQEQQWGMPLNSSGSNRLGMNKEDPLWMMPAQQQRWYLEGQSLMGQQTGPAEDYAMMGEDQHERLSLSNSPKNFRYPDDDLTLGLGVDDLDHLMEHCQASAWTGVQ